MNKKNTLLVNLFALLFISQVFAQTTTCDGILPFEEKDGLITIEMESGVLNDSRWMKGTEDDPNLPGETIEYIYWSGPESFNALNNVQITYNIKINTPGTYRLLWRGRIGKGDSGGEHNDAWLKIVADDFFAERRQNGAVASTVEPTPQCRTNANRACAEGAKVDGYFKVFMNRSPTRPIDERWGFVSNTNDGEAHNTIKATFNTAGNYAIIIDARSSDFFMDKMVLFRDGVQGSTATNLNNPQSDCFDASLSNADFTKNTSVNLYPNPASSYIEISNLTVATGTLILRDLLGSKIREINVTGASQKIDIRDLKAGMYIISNSDKNNFFIKKFIKL